MKLKIDHQKPFTTIGEFKKYVRCRFCDDDNLTSVINLGVVPLAGAFIEKKDLKNLDEKSYPLTLALCGKCKALQTVEVIDPKVLFENYYYSTSKIKTLEAHFGTLAMEIKKTLDDSKKSLVVEIGANDGTLIKQLVQKGVNVIGVDPAKNIVINQIKKGFPLICAYFNYQTAKQLIKTYGKADVITSSNTMAHIEDIAGVFQGIKLLLKKSGYGIIEVHYLKKLINELQYDMIYHEHLYYYSVLSIKKILEFYGLELFDAYEIPIHAGSIRFFLQHKNGPLKIKKSISSLILEEKKAGLHKIGTYQLFNYNIQKQKKDLVTLLKRIKKNSHTVAGYGASGRGNTIMAYSNIGAQFLDYIIDDSPIKQGRFTPGNYLQIVGSDILNSKKKPDYLVLFAWSFYDEIVKKNANYTKSGGKFILPLPSVRIVP